jgi:hypothetical protein
MNQPDPLWQEPPRLEDMVSDLDVYRELLQWAERLSWLAPRCWSVRAGRLVAIAAILTRGLASAIYRNSLAEPDEGAGHTGAR